MPTQPQTRAQVERGLTRRDFIRVTAGMALTLLLPGCKHAPASQSPTQTGLIETGPYRKPGPWMIGRSGRGDINSWMVMCSAHIEHGIKEKYREHFHDYVSRSANWDPNKQIEDIRILLEKGPDLLLIDPLDHPAVEAGIGEAMDSSVPVILTSTMVQNAQYISSVTLNEGARGAACADWMCQSIPGGRVTIIASVPAAGDSKAWLAGVRSRLDAEPNIEDVTVVDCPWESSQATQVMASILRKSTPIDGLIVNNGVLGRGAILAFAEQDRTPPPIAGVDDWNGWLRTAREYEVRFMALSGGANLGLHCVELATRVLAGDPVQHDVEFPYVAFDHSELHRYYRPDLSDHYWAINDLPRAWIERMFNT